MCYLSKTRYSSFLRNNSSYSHCPTVSTAGTQPPFFLHAECTLGRD